MADYSLIEGALQRGYSMDEIADKLAQAEGFDPSAIRARGYGAEDILGRLGYVKPEEVKPEKGFIGNVLDQAAHGVKTAYQGLLSAPGIYAGNPDAERIAGTIQAEQSHEKPKEMREAEAAFADVSKRQSDFESVYGKDSGYMDSIGKIMDMLVTTGKEIVTNPKGMAYEMASQSGNMVAPMVGAYAGGKTGAVTGALLGPKGAVAGGVVGAGAGGFAGSHVMEQSGEFRGKVAERLSELGLEPTAENVSAIFQDKAWLDKTLEETRDKATGTAVTDGVLAAIGGLAVNAPIRAAQKAARAQLSATATAKQVSDAAADILASQPKWQKVAPHLKAGAIGWGGEPISEAIGQQYGYGHVDYGDVGMEAFAAAGEGIGSVYAAAKGMRTKPTLPANVTPPPSITSASNTDDAIKAFKDEVETASPVPRGSFGNMDELAGFIEAERSDIGKRRGLIAQQQQDARDMENEFNGLVKDEQIDQSYRLNDAQKQRDAERAREGGYDLALQQREEQQGRTVEQLAAASEAQGFGNEEPTAMQLAMQQAQQKALDNEFSGLLKQERANLNEMRANVKKVAGVPVESISTPQLKEIAQSEAHPNTKMAAVAALNDRHDAIQQERERLMQLRETRLEKQSNQPEQGAQHGAESHGTDGQVATPSVAGGGANVSGGGFDAAMVAADRGMRGNSSPGAAVSGGGQAGAVPVAEQSANVRALTENAAKRQATQLTNQGFPTVAYPHPTQPGMWAIGSHAEAKSAPAKEQQAQQAQHAPVEPAADDVPVINVRQQTPRKKPASNTLAQAIINLGGISTSLKQDITGDASVRSRPGLFTKNGTADLSELAARLSGEFGFTQIDVNDPADNSGAKQLADLIARSVNGETIHNEEGMILAQQDEEFEQAKAEVNLQAQEIGIKPIRGKRTIDIVQSEINAILAEREEMSRQKQEAQRLLDEVAEQELIDAFNLQMQEYHDENAITRDERREESARLSAEESAQGDGDSVDQASPVAGRASPTEGGRGEAEVTPEFGLVGQTEEEAIAEEQARRDEDQRKADEDRAEKSRIDAEAVARRNEQNANTVASDNFQLGQSSQEVRRMVHSGMVDMFGNNAEPAAKPADPITAVKATLDAAGVTGTDRTTTIAAVRRGDLTPEDVAEAHPVEQENGRDSFTLERWNRETNTLEPVTFERGEYVRYLTSGDHSAFGEIDGISHARREFSVGKLWYPFGAAYKAERPAEAKPETVPLSSVIDKVNSKYGEGLTEEDRVPTPYTIAEHSETIDKLNAGTLTVEEYKAAFARAIESREALAAEFQKMTKDAIMKTARLAGHYKNDTKDRIVKAAANKTVEAFDIRESSTWVMGTDRFASLRNFVEGVTQADLDAYAAKRKAKIEEYVAGRQAMREGIDNPQTLEDFRNAVQMHKHDGKTFAEARMMLTPEQRATFDELTAEESRKTRNYRADQKAVVQVAAATTEGQIVQTKHTKTGEDLFVVKAAERVERDVYNQWNATAKKLGGWYSSFRGAGAVPGFQFKTMENAEAFLKYLGGDVSEAKAAVQERRDAFADDKSQSAVERLREMAERLDEKADEALGRDRKANTARRARFAAAAESAANGDKAMAATMRNIAQAIESGSAKFLDRVRQKTQIEMLNSLVSTALWDYWRAKYPTYSEQERHKGEPAVPEVADYARFPQYTAFRSDLAKLGRQMLEIDGAKKIGQQLLSVADDVTDAYLEFAKANLHKVSTFKRGDGQMAAFSSRDAAEKAIARSGYKGKAIVLPFKRGQNIIVQSPSFAQENGIWEGDGDKLITLNAEVGSAIVAKGKELGRKLDVPSSFGYVAEKQSRLRAMGIETPAEFRAMLREFIGMKQAPKAPDRVKELERAMAGKRNTDGLDFFPTPAGTVQAMLDAAEIEPGMRVLEPSAGMGHIADLIRDAGVEPDVVEMSNERRELLEAKGHNVIGNDFMDVSVADTPDGAGYDRILMNPPFGDRRDAQHVRHAFDLLAPRGRLVAIMGEGVFFGQDKKATEFREWLESVGGTSEKLDEGTFLDPSLPVNTGANARLVVIDKRSSDVAMFNAKSGSIGNPIDAAALESTIASVIAASPSQWRRDTVVTATLFSELPAPIVEKAKAEGYDAHGRKSNGEKLTGVAYDGKVYLVQENISSELEAEETLLHERIHQILHGNAEDENGKALRQSLGRLYSRIGGKDAIVALAKRAGADMSGPLAALPRVALSNRPAFLVDEFLAHVEGQRAYEKFPQSVVRAIREFYGEFRDWLRASKFVKIADAVGVNLGNFTQSDLSWTLKKIRQQTAGTGSKAIRFMTAWHGSPHDHDGFDSSKIGTGEGAQAYGHGLYFASQRVVAEWYKNKLSGLEVVVDGERLNQVFPATSTPEDAALSYARGRLLDALKYETDLSAENVASKAEKLAVKSERDAGISTEADRLAAKAKQWGKLGGVMNDPAAIARESQIAAALRDIASKAKEGRVEVKKGRLYQVELAPAEDELLDWDKTYSEQSEKVKAALDGVEFKYKINDSTKGEDIYLNIALDDSRGFENTGYKAASEYLHSIGIRGIKYLDGTSRDAKKGSHSYVIFNDADVKITAKESRRASSDLDFTQPQGSEPLRKTSFGYANDTYNLFHATTINSSEGDIHVFHAHDPVTGELIGSLGLGLNGDEITVLYNIKDETNSGGFGEKILRSLLAGSKDGLYIVNMLPDAVGFWKKVGVSLDDHLNGAWEHGNGILTEQALTTARGEQSGARESKARYEQAFSGGGGSEKGGETNKTIPSGRVTNETTPANAGVSVSAPTESVRRIQAVVERFKSQFKGATALDIRVVSTTFEIPTRFRPSPFAEGVFHDDEGIIYLVTMNLRDQNGNLSERRAWQVLLHEAVGHYGLARMLGNKFAGILKAVKQATLAGRKVSETQSNPLQPGDKDYTTWEAVQLRYPDATDAEVAQEVLARMSETDSGSSVLGYAVAVVRQWVRDVARAMGINLVVSTSELRDLVAKASGYMRRGDNLAEEHEPSGLVAASEGLTSNERIGPVGLPESSANQSLDRASPTRPYAGLDETLAPANGNGKLGLESRARIIGDSGRQYTPEQQQMFKTVGRETNDLNTFERIKKWANKNWVQGIVDQFAPIKDIDLHAYTLTRLSKGAAGAFEAFMDHGKLSLKDGVYDADTSGGVMQNVFFPLGKETTDFLYWIAGNRAERLAKEGKERLFSPQDIAASKALAHGVADFDYTLSNGQTTRDRTLIYADSLKKFNEYNKNVMDMAEQSGLIDGASRHLWEHEFYVPFYRVMDESDGGVRGMNIKQGVVRQQAFKKLKGGEEGLNDLLANTLMNWAHLIDASAKNRAAKATLDAAQNLGIAQPAGHGEKKTVWYMDGGQKREYSVDDPQLLIALQGLDYAGLRGPIMDFLGKTKHMLTLGVTASPFFKIRNLIRDSVQAVGTSDLSYNIVKNLKQGAELTNHERQEYVSALAGGALIRFGTMLEGNEAARTRQLIKKGAKDEHILDNESKVRAFYDKYLEPWIAAYNELGNRGEEINRMALYDQLIKQKKSHAEASLMARDLMDFSLQGSFTTIRFLTQTVPFMNARLQGLYKLGRSAKDEPAKMAVVTGMVALASLALLAAYGDDDDWKKREDWDRNNYWWFKFGGVAFRIPKPFELGAIGTLAERSAELLFDKEMTGKRFKDTVSAVVWDQLAMNPTPQLVKPIMDIYANKDSFTKRPIESMSMERLDPQYRYNSGTSMVARGTSTAIGGALSPVQIDHLVRGYFGWLGSFAVGAADMAVRAASDEPTRPTMDYWKTATGGMVSDIDSSSSRYVSQMYEQAKELEQAYGTWRQLRKEGKIEDAAEYRADHDSELRKYRAIEGIKKAESKMNERIRMIERSNKDPEVKRELIRQIQKQKDLIARRAF